MGNPLTFAVLVGVGIAAIFYYVFSDSNSHNSHNTYGRNDNDNNSSFEMPNSWTQNNNTRQKNKRRGSNNTDEKISSCTICLTDLSSQQNVEILPCGHSFHGTCIFNWQKQGPQECRECCPNCRKRIESTR